VTQDHSPKGRDHFVLMKSQAILPEFHFAKTKLSNGLEVIIRRQDRLPLVAVNLWYHVGSKDEERRQRGFAHLFEHLMFEGSEHYPGDFFKPLQRLGASINGSTSPDRTNYFEDIPTAHVALAMAMESDRMGHLLPALSDSKLRIQKDVVKNEYRQNYANRPYGQVGRLMAEALYPPSHPYNWLTIGVMEDVEAATRDDVQAFFRRFYVPSNASLSLVGDIDEGRGLELAERYFGDLPGGARAQAPWAPASPLGESVAMQLHDRVELDRVYLAWPTVRHFHPDDAPLSLLADILARGKSSRLYGKLVVEHELAQDVSASQSARELAGQFGATITLRPSRSTGHALALFDAEVAAIADAGVTDVELGRVQNGRPAGFLYALDSIGGFGGVADRLNAYNIYLGDPGRITTDFERYRAVNPEAIRDVARRYLLDRPRVSLTVVGRSATTTHAPLDRGAAPPTAPVAAYLAPRPEVRTLRCGLTLWSIPRRDLPIISATIVLGGGAGRHGPDRGGLAELTASMLDEGTTTRSSYELALAAEGMGTSLSTSCGWDGAYVSVQCLSPHLADSLDLAIDVLRNPTFPGPEWARVHAQSLASLRAGRDNAEGRAYRGLLHALYGPDHPYRVPSDGDEESVARLTRDDLLAFHARFHGPGGAACIVAGDIDTEAFAEALDDRLADWSGPTAPRAEPPIAPRGDATRVILLDRPGAAQAAVRVGHLGLARLDPDYHESLILNHILGGQFTSRLNAKLREEKGFTYGVRSQFDCRRGAGPFSVSASVQTERVGDALVDLRREVVAMLEDRPPTMAELADARRALIEGQARLFETPSALVSRYASLYVHGLPPDHHAHFADRLEAVTLDSLGRAASRQLHPEALVVVVVADASGVLESLCRLEWADVEVIED